MLYIYEPVTDTLRQKGILNQLYLWLVPQPDFLENAVLYILWPIQTRFTLTWYTCNSFSQHVHDVCVTYGKKHLTCILIIIHVVDFMHSCWIDCQLLKYNSTWLSSTWAVSHKNRSYEHVRHTGRWNLPLSFQRRKLMLKKTYRWQLYTFID